MNFKEAKAQIAGYTTPVDFNQSVDLQNNEKLPWATGWIDITRSRISIPLDLFTELKAGAKIDNLFVRSEAKVSKTDGLPYNQFYILRYTPGDLGQLA